MSGIQIRITPTMLRYLRSLEMHERKIAGLTEQTRPTLRLYHEHMLAEAEYRLLRSVRRAATRAWKEQP